MKQRKFLKYTNSHIIKGSQWENFIVIIKDGDHQFFKLKNFLIRSTEYKKFVGI